MPSSVTALIALGANLGQPAETLRSALAALDADPELRVTAISGFYRTPPLGPPQPDYCNACAALETGLGPDPLLERLLALETRFGRQRGERWGPRTLDLDLLAWGDRIHRSDRLTLPHPGLAARAFVLIPLHDIAPTWRHPLLLQTVSELLVKLPSGDRNAIHLWT
jgi:2-amino-4-hydroxy-6-hydroxymethyldihydropteridine diphosphokinase